MSARLTKIEVSDLISLLTAHSEPVWQLIANIWAEFPPQTQIWKAQPGSSPEEISALWEEICHLNTELFLNCIQPYREETEPEFLPLLQNHRDFENFKSYLSQISPQADLIFVEIPNKSWQGRYFLELDFEADWIRWETPGIQVSEWSRSAETLPQEMPAELSPLLALKKALITCAPTEDLEIAWALGQEHLEIYGLRPLDAHILRNDQLSIRHLQSLFPVGLPRLILENYLGAEEKLFDFYRLFTDLKQKRPLIDEYAGRPYLNETELLDIYRVLGRKSTPTGAPVTSGARYLTPGKYSFYLLKWKQEIPKILNQIMETFQIPHTQPHRYLEQIQTIYAYLLQASLSLQEMMLSPLSQLEDRQMLEDWRFFCAPAISAWVSDLLSMREQAQALVVKLGRRPTPSELLQHRSFYQAWQVFLSNHGHRAIENLNLSKPRIDEKPEPYLELLLSPWRSPSTLEAPPLKNRLFKPLWKRVHALVKLRAQVYSDSLWALYQVKRSLKPQLNLWIQKGWIQSEADFWALSLAEVRQPEANLPFLTGRKSPGIGGTVAEALQRFAPELGLPEAPQAEWTGERGLGESREGIVWCPNPDQLCLPEGFQPWSTILVVRVLDPSLLPYLIQVAGVICESGPDYDLGSLILYELGLSALQGVRQIGLQLQTGDKIRLDPQALKVIRLSSTAGALN